jgi:hypothetical protein
LLLPHSNSYIRKTLILAGIMWFVLFLVLALKYPANPPAVGVPEIICYRESLYTELIVPIYFLLFSGIKLSYITIFLLKGQPTSINWPHLPPDGALCFFKTDIEFLYCVMTKFLMFICILEK